MGQQRGANPTQQQLRRIDRPIRIEAVVGAQLARDELPTVVGQRADLGHELEDSFRTEDLDEGGEYVLAYERLGPVERLDQCGSLARSEVATDRRGGPRPRGSRSPWW